MELYRLEDGTLKKFKGGFVVLNNRIYTNPTEETVRKAGYKGVIYDGMPEYDEARQYISEVYTEDDTTIYVGYEIKELEAGEINDG